jgi:hypothetical protein
MVMKAPGHLAELRQPERSGPSAGRLMPSAAPGSRPPWRYADAAEDHQHRPAPSDQAGDVAAARRRLRLSIAPPPRSSTAPCWRCRSPRGCRRSRRQRPASASAHEPVADVVHRPAAVVAVLVLLAVMRTAQTASAYLVAMPKSAVIHIQNRAPGPPRAIAVATPAMLPVPMVAESEVIRALNGRDVAVAPPGAPAEQHGL